MNRLSLLNFDFFNSIIYSHQIEGDAYCIKFNIIYLYSTGKLEKEEEEV